MSLLTIWGIKADYNFLFQPVKGNNMKKKTVKVTIKRWILGMAWYLGGRGDRREGFEGII